MSIHSILDIKFKLYERILNSKTTVTCVIGTTYVGNPKFKLQNNF